MKKQGLLLTLGNMRAVAEEQGCDEELSAIRRTELLDHLLTYINDPQIREAVETIPF